MKRKIMLVSLMSLAIFLVACKKDETSDKKEEVSQQIVSNQNSGQVNPEELGQVMNEVWGDNMVYADGAQEDVTEAVSSAVSEGGEIDETDTAWLDNIEVAPEVDLGWQWNVSVINDMIKGDRMLYTTESLNSHHLNNGETHMTLFIREKPTTSNYPGARVSYDMFFKVNGGVFACVSDCMMNAKVGGKVHRVAYTNSNDYSMDKAFVSAPQYYFEMMLKDDVLVVEPTFVHVGNRQFEFDVSNFPGKIFKDQ